MRLLVLTSVLALAACDKDETIYSHGGAGGEWHLQSLNGAAFAATATMRFEEDGAVVGQAPCNMYSTQQSMPYPQIAFGPVRSTRMACPDLAAEQQFLSALERVTRADVEGDSLTMASDDGDEMVFRRQSAPGG